MRRLLSWQLQTKLHIFLDKILHKHLRISDSKLNRTGIQYIFMIGKQVAAVKSMVAYYRKYIEEGGAIDGCNLPGTVENAVLQYANRMSFLAETGTRLRQLAKRALLVRAEDLIGEPRSVLSQLQRFLHLRSPLDEHYSVFDRTGAWNLSDTSNFIRKGKIERERPPHAEISPPDQLADTANRTYEYCLAVLTDSFTLATSAKPVEVGSMASEV